MHIGNWRDRETEGRRDTVIKTKIFTDAKKSIVIPLSVILLAQGQI